MENVVYATITRQSGLLAQMQAVANNIANLSTTGYKAEGVVFSEHVTALGADQPSLSMATARVRDTREAQGALELTGGPLDLAIEGEGYFLIETPEGQRLTRAGAFGASATGNLVTAEGYPVLDAGGTPVIVPAGAGPISIARDGTVSAAGQPVGQVGLVMPADPLSLTREDGVRFRFEGGLVAPEGSRMIQGFLERSNVNPVTEIARMIAVQRAYEWGQNLMDREDTRMRSLIDVVVNR